MKKFIQLKRHLHSLTLVLTLVCLNLFISNDWMQFAQIGPVAVCLITLIANGIVAFGIEWYQGKFKGANRTRKEFIGAVQDFVTGVCIGMAGLPLYYFFDFGYWHALVVFVIAILMEVYRRKDILNK